jgi:hypothetical protein
MAKPPAEPVAVSGEILAATLVEEGVALLLGWGETLLPETARLADGDGAVRTHSWPRGEGGQWFLALVEGAAAFRLAGTNPLLVTPNGRLRYALPAVERLALDASALLDRLASLAAEAPALIDFLQSTPAALRFALLARIAQPDGFIEIFGRADPHTILLQGWSTRLTAGAVELVLETGGFRPCAALVATYDRPDLGTAGRGLLALLPAAEDLHAVRRVFWRAGQTWHRLEIFENRRFLGDAETTPFLKGLFPALALKAASAPLFKRLCAARYEGAETISGLPQPVRAALDLAVAVAGAGMFLTGWVLDPERRVAEVSLCNGTGFRQRLDQGWIRTNRADVTEGYGRDPLFAGRLTPGDDAHGFVVALPCQPDERGDWHMELALDNGETVAFLPVPATPPCAGAVRRMLSSVNIFDPASEPFIARQLAPLVAAAAAQAGPRIRAAAACAFGPPLKQPKVSAIVPLLREAADFDINLARFSRDPDMAEVELIVVTRAAWASALGARLQKQARFYGRSGRLLVTGDDLDLCAALETGAEAAAAGLLLLLSPSVFPSAPGWVTQLAEAARASGGAVCPTLVYEDESIRFAGSDTAIRPRLSGYPRSWLKRAGNAAQPSRAGTLECCMIPRAALAQAGGLPRDYVGAEMRGPDFFLRLAQAGVPCHWLPWVELTALDDPSEAAPPEYWMQTGKLVDEWSFAGKWGKSAA